MTVRFHPILALFALAQVPVHAVNEKGDWPWKLKPSDTEAQVMAGIYLELFGKTADADMYYSKAGDESAEVIEGLFE